MNKQRENPNKRSERRQYELEYYKFILKLMSKKQSNLGLNNKESKKPLPFFNALPNFDGTYK